MKRASNDEQKTKAALLQGSFESADEGSKTHVIVKRWSEWQANEHFIVKRLRGGLTPAQQTQLAKEGLRYQGFSYDLLFEWSDTKMYCSELVWKIFNSIGIELSPKRPMRDYQFDHPVVQKLLRERWGKHVNWEEPMVAPSDLVESQLVTTVYKSARPLP